MKNQPLALIAELTHRCPLHCVYCSNPLEMQAKENELSTEKWIDIFSQCSKLGVLHAHLTGGEPLARSDIKEIVSGAHKNKLYTNLITSGLGLTQNKLDELIGAGLDHVQLSFQDSDEKIGNEISGTKSHAHKLATAQIISKSKVAFTINMVIHRQNISRLSTMIELAHNLGATKLEVAHVQYYGWAFKNREHLLPTREQLDETIKIIADYRKKLKDKLRIEFVVPDYYGQFPKPCMGGWGKQLILIDPSGKVLPCHAAGVLPGLKFENVKEHKLQWIWEESDGFQKYRGTDWMPEPCQSCDRKAIDFGGCRCQAFLIAGDSGLTDPICSLSPHRSLVESVIESIAPAPVSTVIPSWSHRKL
jgi:PqqA peptide cyclase